MNHAKITIDGFPVWIEILDAVGGGYCSKYWGKDPNTTDAEALAAYLGNRYVSSLIYDKDAIIVAYATERYIKHRISEGLPLPGM